MKRMIAESAKRVLREYDRDIDDDAYFGGGLPDSYSDNDGPLDTDRISKEQLAQLDNIADMIADIANNTSDDTELLHQAVKNIEEFMMGYKQQGN